jgi:sialidase-1
VVASSGLRTQHVDPFGKTVLNVSHDDGKTWSSPRVINDSPLDDRDAGVVSLGGERLLVSWFTSDTRQHFQRLKVGLTPEEIDEWEAVFDRWTDDLMRQWLGSWVILSDDGGQTWGEPIRVPVNTPHGPIRLKSGGLLYLGKTGFRTSDRDEGAIAAARSTDGGRTWDLLGSVPPCDGTRNQNYHEPHVAELPDGRLAATVRFQYAGDDDPASGAQISFSLFQTESDDGGKTWTQARPTGVHGSPPHLLQHSSGALVCVYGYREAPYGQRAMISSDGGVTWASDIVIRDDGPDVDLGYPCSVEMPDRSVLTVYYQQCAANEQCSLLWSRWQLP